MSVGLLVFPFINVQFVRTNFFFGNPKLHLILGLLCWSIRKKVPSMQSFRFLPFELCGFHVLMSVGLLVFPFINVQFVRTNFFFGNPKLHLILGLLCWSIRKKVPSMQSFISSTTSSISSLE